MAVVELLVPTLAASFAGNTITADRYAEIFVALGHQTGVVKTPSIHADLVVALNAYRSADGIASVAPEIPVVVVLTGTDIYRFMAEDPGPVLASLDRGRWLVGLNDLVGDVLAPEVKAKLVVIKEGAAPGLPRSPDPSRFRVAVVGHLRAEKDPELVAEAALHLSPASGFQVCHYGEAHSEDWARWARRETAFNPCWEWRGHVTRTDIAQVYAVSQLLVNSSRIEGGANVISEAVMAGLPILASDIDGNVGVLGRSYPGYFTAGDPTALRTALVELAADRDRLIDLTEAAVACQSELSEERERRAWSSLLTRMGIGP